MIRTLAFVIAVCCCIGLIGGTYTAIAETHDDVTFTEEVRFGDPAVLDGREVTFGVDYSNHLIWNFTYRFGPEDSHDTVFHFNQIPTGAMMPRELRSEVLSVYAHSGWGASTSGSFDLNSTDYADMFRTVAAMTPNGGRNEMNLKLKDFMDFHVLNFDLDYQSDRYFASESVDQFVLVSHPDDTGDSPSYDVINDLFRFPVQEDDIVTVSVWVNQAGGVTDMNYSTASNYTISLVASATDQGIYCIPVYRNEDTGATIPGNYAQGMGLYFIPWKAYQDPSIISSTKTQVMLDGEGAKNILPLPGSTSALGLTIDEESGNVWLLTLELGQYVLTRLSLDTMEMLDRFPLMEQDPAVGGPEWKWILREGLIMVYASGELALVTDSETPNLEFITPVGETADGLYYLSRETTAMVYEDGRLYLADTPYYNNHLNMMVFDASGPLYWGNYFCSLYECNRPGGEALTPYYDMTGLK